jgi:predicted GIY-YIG superfamily endonuclease
VSTTLYRLFAGDGRLLYVGIADDPLARFKQHRRDKFWWPRVTATSMQQFDTRVEAEAAEARAIFTENPVHNMAGADPERPDRTLADHPLLVDGIPWRCFHCNRSAFPGYLQLGEDEFHRYNRALVAWIRDNLETFRMSHEERDRAGRGPGSAFALIAEATYPAPMEWDLTCFDCDKGRAFPFWWCYTDAIRWFGDTNWDGFIDRLRNWSATATQPTTTGGTRS